MLEEAKEFAKEGLQIFKKNIENFDIDRIIQKEKNIEELYNNVFVKKAQEREAVRLQVEEQKRKAIDQKNRELRIASDQTIQQWREQIFENPDNEMAYAFAHSEDPLKFNIDIDSVRISEKDRYRRLKDAYFQLAKMDSATQGFVNAYERFIGARENDKVLSPEEAMKYAKDEGVDLKYTKPVSEVEVLQAVSKNKIKQQLEYQIASLREGGSFSTMQEIMLWGTSVAGSTNLGEVAVDIGLSFLVPQLAVMAIAKSGITGLRTINAVRTAYALSHAKLETQKYLNSMRILQQGYRARSFASKATYGAEKIALQTSMAKPLGKFLEEARETASKGILKDPVAIDRYMRSLHKTISEYGGAEKFFYNTAAMVEGIDQIGGGLTLAQKIALGGADAFVSNIPFMTTSALNSRVTQTGTYDFKSMMLESLFVAGLGAGIPIAGKVFGMGFKAGKDAIADLSSTISKRKVQNQMQKAMTGISNETVEKEADNLTKGLKDISAKAPDSIVDAAEKIANSPLNEMEFYMVLEHLTECIITGKTPSLNSLPLKTPLLTQLRTSMADMLDMLPTDAEELTEILTEKTVGERTWSTAVKFKNETGLLGRDFVKGFTRNDAIEMQKLIYKAEVQGSAEARETLNDKLGRYRSQIQNLQELKREIVEGREPSPEDFYQIRENIVGRLMYGYDWDRLLDKERANYRSQIMSNTVEELTPEEKLMKEAVKQKSKLLRINAKDQPRDFIDSIDKFINDLQDIVDTNEKLVNTTDNILTEQYKNADNMLDKIMNPHEDTGVLKDILGTEKISTKDLEAKIKDIAEKRVNSEKITAKLSDRIEKAKTEGTFDAMIRAAATINSIVKAGTLKSVTKVPFTIAQESVRKASNFVANRLPEIKGNIISAISKNEEIGKYLEGLTTGDQTAQDKAKEFLWGNKSPIRATIKENLIKAAKKEVGVHWTDQQLAESVDRAMKGLSETDWNNVFQRSRNKTTDEVEIAKDIVKEQENLAEQVDKLNKRESILTTEEKQRKENLEFELNQQSQADLNYQRQTITENLVNDRSRVAGIEAIVQPFLDEIEDRILTDKILDTQFIINQINDFERMLKNVNYADEVIAGIYSSTPYEITGAGNNIQTVSKQYTRYLTEINNELIKRSTGTTASEKITNTGMDLLAYKNDKSNRDSIMEAIAWLDHFSDVASAKDAGAKLNDADFIIAEVIKQKENEVLARNYQYGSKKTRIASRENSRKRNNYAYMLVDQDNVETVSKMQSFIESIGDNKQYKDIVTILDRFLHNEKFHKRLGLFSFGEHDLDTMFPRTGMNKLTMNKARDIVLSGDIKALEKLSKEEAEEFKDVLKNIGDSILGSTEKTGWVSHCIVGSQRISKNINGTRSMFVEEANMPIAYKNVQSQVKANKIFGFDTIDEQLHNDFGNLQREYAVLSRVGADPIKYTNSLIDLYRGFVENNKRAGKYETKEVLDRVTLSESKARWLQSITKIACGIDDIPAAWQTRAFQVFSNVVTSPLLVGAGLRSLTDYTTQHQWMVQNGLMSRGNILGWTRGVGLATKILNDPDLKRMCQYNLALTASSIIDYVTSGEAGAITRRGLSKDAPLLTKVEDMARNWSNVWINTIGNVERFTNIQRSSSALNIMRSLASDDINVPYDDLITKHGEDIGGRLQGLLDKHDINKQEWEFMRRFGIKEFREHIENMTGKPSNIKDGFKMFSPESLANVSAKEIKNFLEKEMHNISVTKADIDNFRELMIEKAMCMINLSADEMVSLPTARTAAFLNLGGALTKNEGLGTAMASVLKFQSFGVAANQIHHGRRIAHYIDTTDSTCYATVLNKLFGTNGFSLGMYRDLLGFTVNFTLATMAIDAVVDPLQGKGQSWKNEKGELNLKDKVLDPFVSTLFFAGIFFDAFLGNIEKGGSRGGGISVLAAPAFSASIKPIKEFFRDTSKAESVGDFAYKGSMSLAKSAGKVLSLDRIPFIALLYNEMIGNYIEKESQGADRYYKYLRRRRKEGFNTDWFGANKGEHTEPFFGLFDQ